MAVRPARYDNGVPFSRAGPDPVVLTSADRRVRRHLGGSVLTHGHPTAGAGLAVLVHHLVHGIELVEAVRRTIHHLRRLDGHEETTAAWNVRGAGRSPTTATAGSSRRRWR